MSLEVELMKHIKSYRIRVLNEVDGAVLDMFLDKPLPDFTEQENGYESALAETRRKIQELKSQ